MPSPSRVLVVDDSATIRRVVSAMLNRAGYEVVQAGDGVQALASLKRERVDLALVDFVMPKLNGFELCRQIREDAALKGLPIVLMSAKADRIRDHFLRQTGALEAISKPFDQRALLLTIESALAKPGAAAGTAVGSAAAPATQRDTTEIMLSDPYWIAGSGVRTAVPQAWLLRLAELLMRVSPQTGDIRNPAQVISVLRRVLGDHGISTLYDDLVGALASAVLSGDLGAIPLAEVLQLLQLQRQSGLITIFNGETEVQIALREGLIDLATARGHTEEFRIGRFLLQDRKLKRSQLDDFLERERRSMSPRFLGDALVEEKILTRAEVDKALARQTSELVYEVLRWTRGRFVFDQKAKRLYEASAQLGLPVPPIVMEGFRRIDEWRLLEEALGGLDRLVVLEPGARETTAAQRLNRDEQAVLDGLDGERSIRAVALAVGQGTFEVCKILQKFIQLRLVRREASP